MCFGVEFIWVESSRDKNYYVNILLNLNCCCDITLKKYCNENKHAKCHICLRYHIGKLYDK